MVCRGTALLFFYFTAGPSRDRDNNRKYESGYQKRKKAVKRKESEVLQQCGLLKFLKPANINY
jgi:hypothetical protein